MEGVCCERASLGKSRGKWHVRFKLKFEKDKYGSCAENGSKDIYVVCAICAKAGVQTNVHKTGGGKKTPQRPLSIDNFKQTHCSRDMHVNAQSTLKSRSTAAPDEGGVGGASPAAETATAGAQTKKQKASVITPHLSRDVCVGWLCRLPGGQLDRRAALPTLARAPVVPLSVPTPALTSPPLSLCPLAPSAPAARAARSRPLLAPSARAACSRRTLVPPARAVRSRLTLFPHAPRSRGARTSLSLHHVRGAFPARASLSSLQGRWFRCRVCGEGEEDGEESCGRQSRGRAVAGRAFAVHGDKNPCARTRTQRTQRTRARRGAAPPPGPPL